MTSTKTRLTDLMSDEDRAQEEKWAEDIKYYAARFCWKMRDQRCRGKPYTWATWFERRFEENLNSYANRMKGKRKKSNGGSRSASK